MARLVNISNIDVFSKNELVEVRGSINRIGVGFFHLLDLAQNFALPEFLKCIYDKKVQFEYAKVIVYVAFIEKEQIQNLQKKFNPSKEYLKRLVLNVKTIQYITVEEVKEISYAESNRTSVFNGADLSSIEFASSFEAVGTVYEPKPVQAPPILRFSIDFTTHIWHKKQQSKKREKYEKKKRKS